MAARDVNQMPRLVGTIHSNHNSQSFPPPLPPGLKILPPANILISYGKAIAISCNERIRPQTRTSGT
jgi:hypothetical protein